MTSFMVKLSFFLLGGLCGMCGATMAPELLKSKIKLSKALPNTGRPKVCFYTVMFFSALIIHLAKQTNFKSNFMGNIVLFAVLYTHSWSLIFFFNKLYIYVICIFQKKRCKI